MNGSGTRLCVVVTYKETSRYGFIKVMVFENQCDVLVVVAMFTRAWLGIVDDFRTFEWIDNIQFPEIVYQELGAMLVGTS